MKKTMAKSRKAVLVTSALIAFSAPVAADMVTTDQVAGQSDRDRVRAFLERKDAEKQMKALGVAPDVAKQRVDAMTDEEVQVVAAKIESLPAGAALSQTDWIIILLLVVLLIVVI